MKIIVADLECKKRVERLMKCGEILGAGDESDDCKAQATLFIAKGIFILEGLQKKPEEEAKEDTIDFLYLIDSFCSMVELAKADT